MTRAIRLVRVGKDARVEVEASPGVFVTVISERFDSAFCHIVEPGKIDELVERDGRGTPTDDSLAARDVAALLTRSGVAGVTFDGDEVTLPLVNDRLLKLRASVARR